MPETVRFAPSPTGEIHIGNARTALYNYAVAVQTGGSFILRFDDTDVERSRAEYAAAIEADLAWLGIEPSRLERQSERLAFYDAAADRLRAAGALYACYETPEELERKRALQRARGRPPVYDRAGLALTPGEKAAYEAEGRRPHWRFRLPDGARTWDDRCRGEQMVNLDSISDPVLVREDGTYLYTLTSVVDDIDMGVTLVVRGEDHITNTGVQIAIFEALGAAAPDFGHHNLLTRADGEPLSKRDNPLSLTRLRAEEVEPMAVASLAVLTGTSHPVEPVADLAALCARADLASISRGPATFDPADVERLNAALLHEMPFEAVAPWLAETYGVTDPAVWAALRGNLGRRRDIGPWIAILRDGPAAVQPGSADRPVLEAALQALPAEPWDEGTFKGWTSAVKAATGAKGKALFMPLRLALTGEEKGPELGPFFLLLGRDATARRLEAALARAG
ncbi:glutamate--tRNA ligase [Acuticoccus sediminis]|uniref:Glutamate--tRNA ligase n=1 Tax=Acuticoccus sediminis TaxID=2184697 RepID=A0A8B2NL25_9HYPH|nr:glutamate--tRNA ligase [Acuticoccus sediminis]RAH97027.1 glutamate--tRNA ligase [Acuticoccus sediminis]